MELEIQVSKCIFRKWKKKKNDTWNVPRDIQNIDFQLLKMICLKDVLDLVRFEL